MRYWETPEYREESELRHAEAIAALPWRRKVARWWWINWPAAVTVLAMVAFVIGALLWLS